MHESLKRYAARQSPGPMRGTFYPDDAASGRSAGAVVPKLLAVLVAMAVIRTLAAKHGHGGLHRRTGRRAAIAELHRELHAQEVAGAEVPASS